MAIQIQVGFDLRSWVTYEIEGDLTAEQLSMLRKAENDALPYATRRLLVDLADSGRLKPVLTLLEEKVAPFEAHRDPAVISVWTEDGQEGDDAESR